MVCVSCVRACTVCILLHISDWLCVCLCLCAAGKGLFIYFWQAAVIVTEKQKERSGEHREAASLGFSVCIVHACVRVCRCKEGNAEVVETQASCGAVQGPGLM